MSTVTRSGAPRDSRRLLRRSPLLLHSPSVTGVGPGPNPRDLTVKTRVRGPCGPLRMVYTRRTTVLTGDTIQTAPEPLSGRVAGGVSWTPRPSSSTSFRPSSVPLSHPISLPPVRRVLERHRDLPRTVTR